MIVIAGALLLLSSGCASTHVQGATQVGGPDSATWVYVQTSRNNVDGIYRCIDSSGQVTCTKAKLR